jgi:hypothetical protein
MKTMVTRDALEKGALALALSQAVDGASGLLRQSGTIFFGAFGMLIFFRAL